MSHINSSMVFKIHDTVRKLLALYFAVSTYTHAQTLR
jgi:hypothetical protein